MEAPPPREGGAPLGVGRSRNDGDPPGRYGRVVDRIVAVGVLALALVVVGAVALIVASGDEPFIVQMVTPALVPTARP
jgi:hypothetical protein